MEGSKVIHFAFLFNMNRVLLSCGNANLVHHFEDSRGQGGQALRHEAEEVRVRLLVGEVKLETVLHLVSFRFVSFRFGLFGHTSDRACERVSERASERHRQQNGTT